MADRNDDDRLRAALFRPVDAEALSRRVQTRLAAESPRSGHGWARPGVLVGAYAGAAVLCLALGWQGGDAFAADPLLDLALGSVSGLVQ